MDSTFIVSIATKLFYWYCKILGLFPIHYNSQKKLFTWTWREIVYSTLISLNFSYFYWTNVYNLFIHLNPIVVFAYFLFNLCTLAAIFVVQCLHVGKLANLLNQLAVLLKNEFNNIQKSLSLWQIIRSGMRFFQKIIFINGIATAATMVFCETLCKIVTGKIDYVVIFVMSMMYILQMLIPHMFYAYILVISIHLRQLNAEIQKIRNKVSVLGTNDDGGTTPNLNDRFIELNHRLGHLFKLHRKIGTITRQVNQVFSFQLLVVIGNLIIMILIEVNLSKGIRSNLFRFWLTI